MNLGYLFKGGFAQLREQIAAIAQSSYQKIKSFVTCVHLSVR